MREPVVVPDRLSAMFARCRAQKESALVTYIMGGDPDLATSREMALACVAGGADMLEIGVPFSDPVADGPTIQHAAERSLARGTTLADCIALTAAVREKAETPVALMGYLNPILAYGQRKFFEHCAQAGVDAIIVPDLLPEEAIEIGVLAKEHGVKTVFLLAPTSNAVRRAAATSAATGFIYFVSVTGVTGAREALPEELAIQLAEVRAQSPVPVVVGFGISGPEQAKALGALADGIVVGSAIVNRIAEGGSRQARSERVTRFVRSLKRTLLRR